MHWAVATGIDRTTLMSASAVPGRPSRHCSTSMTTSRWMSRSWLKMRPSWVRLTVPSIEFSMATKPTSTVPSATACSTAAMETSGTSSPAARSGSLSSACSVNVPSGPRNPTRRPVRGDEGTWAE